MKTFQLRAAAIIFFGAVLGGCNGSPPVPSEAIQEVVRSTPESEARAKALPENADEVIVYSLRWDWKPKEHPKGTELMHGQRVLGKISIREPGEMKEVLDGVRHDIAFFGNPAHCFEPRHAVRVIREGKPVDFLICFSCRQYEELTDGTDWAQTQNFGRTSKAILDRLLTDAGVPLDDGRLDW